MLRRIFAALDASLVLDVRWRAGALDRLIDEAHAALGGSVAELLTRLGWIVRVEVTYSEYGERGSIDLVAFWPASGILLVVELKTDLPGIDPVLRKLDEKVRLAPQIVRERFGWDVRHVGWLLVMPESSVLRRRVARQEALLRQTFPVRGSAVQAWLRTPAGAIAGLWFLSPSRGVTRIQGTGGPQRVRAAKSVTS